MSYHHDHRFHAFVRLNPFENQVYFHAKAAKVEAQHKVLGLNPFENQVYFHYPASLPFFHNPGRVLIPLRIRSISTG